MNDTKPLLEEVLKDTLGYLKEPLLFRNILQNSDGSYKWELFKWNFSEFAEKLGNLKLPFRVGYNARLMDSQWERHCLVKHMTLQEFIENTKESKGEKWYYFDYKYMQEWFGDKPEIMTSLSWCKFGIDEDGFESTMWIGSKGAHTNCHQDSYGYNLVAQIHGRKEWLLFPPKLSNFLEPTRVPYEESTIYSKFNFFCPSKENEKKVLDMPYKPKVIILEPGDVLFVPWGWWHYVESLDHSMSINIWSPLKEDNKERVKEVLVKLTIARIGGQRYLEPKDKDKYMSYYTELVDLVLLKYKKDMENTTAEFSSAKRVKYTPWTVEDLVMQYPEHITLLHDLGDHELQKFLQEKRERFPESNFNQDHERYKLTKEIPPFGTPFEAVINALCHPDVINKATELLLQSTTSK